jgi:hypothetical protein
MVLIMNTNYWIVYATESGDWGIVTEDEWWEHTFRQVHNVNRIAKVYGKTSEKALEDEHAERVVGYAEMVNCGLFQRAFATEVA